MIFYQTAATYAEATAMYPEAATILFIAPTQGSSASRRLVDSMGLHPQLPDGVRRLHSRFRTPWIGVMLFGGIACITLIPGQATLLGNMYAFGAMSRSRSRTSR